MISLEKISECARKMKEIRHTTVAILLKSVITNMAKDIAQESGESNNKLQRLYVIWVKEGETLVFPSDL